MTIQIMIVVSIFALMAHCVSTASLPDFSVRTMKIGDHVLARKAENCGNVPFKLSWSPDVLSALGSVTVQAEYTFPYEFSSGAYNATVYFHGSMEPVIGYSDSITCKDISKYTSCPIKKGAHFQYTYTFRRLNKIASYPGDYDAVVTVANQDNQNMICMKMHITIKNF